MVAGMTDMPVLSLSGYFMKLMAEGEFIRKMLDLSAPLLWRSTASAKLFFALGYDTNRL